MVKIRKLKKSDGKKIVCWRNDDRVRFNLLNQDLITIEQQNNYYENYIKTKRIHQFVIVYNGLDCGTTFLKNLDPVKKDVEFGIFVGEKSALGHNVSYDATLLTIDYAFRSLPIESIYLFVLDDNVIAKGLYNKIGFTNQEVVVLETSSGLKRKAYRMVFNKNQIGRYIQFISK